jgi:hypothetical protein
LLEGFDQGEGDGLGGGVGNGLADDEGVRKLGDEESVEGLAVAGGMEEGEDEVGGGGCVWALGEVWPERPHAGFEGVASGAGEVGASEEGGAPGGVAVGEGIGGEGGWVFGAEGGVEGAGGLGGKYEQESEGESHGVVASVTGSGWVFVVLYRG